VSPLDAGEEGDPDRLKNWRGRGQPVLLGEAEAKTMELTLDD
jgi:hypothetical protein